MRKILISLFSFLLVLQTLPPKIATAASYSDVTPSHRFYEDIMLLLDRGVVEDGTRYGINDSVTREQVAIMVSKAVGLPGGKAKTPFKDIPATQNSSGYIKSAVDAGIITGFPDGTFRPKEIVNRGQMAIFLARALGLTLESKDTFIDISPKMVAYHDIKRVVAARITEGFADNTFRPNQALTKGQISAFLARAIRMVEDENPTTPLPTPIPEPKEIDPAVQAVFALVVAGEIAEEDYEFIYYQEFPNNVYLILHQVDFGSGINTTVNGWIVKNNQIVDYLWIGSIYNENFYTNPLIYEYPQEQPPGEYNFSLYDFKLYSSDGDFLGELNTNQYDSDSIFNPYSTYGSKYSSKSIFNEYGQYGSKYSSSSALNELATSPPEIYYNGDFVGYLTVNDFKLPGYTIDEFYELLVYLGKWKKI